MTKMRKLCGKLRGGWEESQEDFVNYKQNVIEDEFPNLEGVQRTMAIELINWANSKFNLGLTVRCYKQYC
jgi:hypothetical protein